VIEMPEDGQCPGENKSTAAASKDAGGSGVVEIDTPAKAGRNEKRRKSPTSRRVVQAKATASNFGTALSFSQPASSPPASLFESMQQSTKSPPRSAESHRCMSKNAFLDGISVDDVSYDMWELLWCCNKYAPNSNWFLPIIAVLKASGYYASNVYVALAASFDLINGVARLNM
jgi:hypothetical protein